MKTLSKFTQTNFIGDVWEPHYNGDFDGTQGVAEVYIALWKLRRSKNDIKLRFEKVNSTSAYAGDWYISLKEAKKFRKRMDNNGVNCAVIPWSAFEQMEVNNINREEIW